MKYLYRCPGPITDKSGYTYQIKLFDEKSLTAAKKDGYRDSVEKAVEVAIKDGRRNSIPDVRPEVGQKFVSSISPKSVKDAEKESIKRRKVKVKKNVEPLNEVPDLLS